MGIFRNKIISFILFFFPRKKYFTEMDTMPTIYHRRYVDIDKLHVDMLIKKSRMSSDDIAS